MRLKTKFQRNYENDQWHKWFAWYPVKWNGYWIFLELVERQKFQYWGDTFKYRYREVGEC